MELGKIDTSKKIALAALGVTTLGALAALGLYMISQDEEEEVEEEGEEVEKGKEEEDPDMLRALDLKAQGNAAFKKQDFEEAIRLYSEALAIKGIKDPHLIYSNRSAAYYFLKKFSEALGDAEKCIEINSDWQKGYFRAAKAYSSMGEYDAAYMILYKGLLIQKGNQELEQFLEDTTRQLGLSELDHRARLDEQLASFYYRKTAQQFCNNVLNINYDEASQIVKDAVAAEAVDTLLEHEKLEPLFEEHPVELAQVLVEILMQKGVDKFGQAFDITKKAEEKIHPQQDARLYLMLINAGMRTLMSVDNLSKRLVMYNQAVQYCRDGLKIEPRNLPLSHMYAALLTNYLGTSSDVKLPVSPREALKELNICLDNPKTNHLIIADSGIRLWFKLFEDESITRQLIEEEQKNQRENIPEDQAYIHGLLHGAFSKLVVEDFFMTSLATVLFNNPAIEKILTPFRKAFLSLSPGEEFNKLSTLIHSTALQCWRANYSWNTKQEEIEKVNQLEQETIGMLSTDIESLVTDGILDEKLYHHLSLISLYKPLSSVKGIAEIVTMIDTSKWPRYFAEIFKKSVLNSIEEQELCKSIKELTPIPESEIKDFYNSFTPVWDSAGFYAGRMTTISVEKELAWTYPKYKPIGEFHKVLFAGCGSGQEVYQAATLYDDIDITAVDISANSLAYAVRQNKELGVEAKFYLADITSLDPSSFDEEDQQFDMIIATSVLHHLEDPMQGWTKLVALIRPGGLMKVSVYNQNNSRILKVGREFAAEKLPQVFDRISSPPKVVQQPSRDELRAVRAEILDSEDEKLQTLIMLPSFYSIDEFRELLFHPTVKGFGYKDIGEYLENLEMNLVGFEFSGISQETVLKYRVEHPDDPELRNCNYLEEFSTRHPNDFTHFSNQITFLLEKPQ